MRRRCLICNPYQATIQLTLLSITAEAKKYQVGVQQGQSTSWGEDALIDFGSHCMKWMF